MRQLFIRKYPFTNLHKYSLFLQKSRYFSEIKCHFTREKYLLISKKSHLSATKGIISNN